MYLDVSIYSYSRKKAPLVHFLRSPSSGCCWARCEKLLYIYFSTKRFVLFFSRHIYGTTERKKMPLLSPSENLPNSLLPLWSWDASSQPTSSPFPVGRQSSASKKKKNPFSSQFFPLLVCWPFMSLLPFLSVPPGVQFDISGPGVKFELHLWPTLHCGNSRSSTYCTGLGLEPAKPQR